MYTSKLEKIRKEKRMTLDTLSKLANVSSGYLCHLEKGSRKNPSIEVMSRISEALNTSITEIFFE